jgi:ferric-dicitrate binding protein FerR (iron transport regulator)
VYQNMHEESDASNARTDFQAVDGYLSGNTPSGANAPLAALKAEFSQGREIVPPDVDAAWGRLAKKIGPSSHKHQPDNPATLSMHRVVVAPGRRAKTFQARGQRGVQTFIGTLSVLALLVVAIVFALQRSDHQLTVQQYSTQTAQRATVTLMDGTVATLAPGSTLRFVQDQGTGRRDVYLDGEAYFKSAHDAAHPFVVFAGNTSTQVLGTSFGVRRYRDDRDARIFVTEGRVAVSGAGVLVPGDVVEMTVMGDVSIRHHADVEAYRAWTFGRLTFNREPFRDVIPRLERWYGVTIHVTDPMLNDVPLTAVFRDQSVANLVGVLATALEARVDEHGQLITLSSR